MKKRTGLKDRSNLKISFLTDDEGLQINILKNKFQLRYPKKIFSSLSPQAQDNLAANFIYSRTAPLILAFRQPIDYYFPKPQLKRFLDNGLIADLPRISEDLGRPTAKLLTDFNSRQKMGLAKFLNGKDHPLVLPRQTTDRNRVIIAMSFGKDSLLTYGLAKELGLACRLVCVDDEIEKFDSTDFRFKRVIFRQFCREQKETVYFLKDNIDFKDTVDRQIGDKVIRNKAEDLEHANAMPAFLLELLPFAYHFNARYVVFGNEKNFDDSFVNRYGYKAYPSVDQTSSFTKKENEAVSKLTGGNLQAVSLIEPIYNLAEMHLLFHRYPHLLKYVMSCSPGQKDTDKWCYHCPMCAKAFLYSLAVGGDPKKIGFKKNLFQSKYRELFPLTARRISRYYEKPPAVREEQLLAFLLAYRQGATGALIELFKKRYLSEAQKKESALRRKFFGVHQAVNIPPAIRSRILKIYREELRNLI